MKYRYSIAKKLGHVCIATNRGGMWVPGYRVEFKGLPKELENLKFAVTMVVKPIGVGIDMIAHPIPGSWTVTELSSGFTAASVFTSKEHAARDTLGHLTRIKAQDILTLVKRSREKAKEVGAR